MIIIKESWSTSFLWKHRQDRPIFLLAQPVGILNLLQLVCLWSQSCNKQHAKKVVSNSLGLVDFATRLMNSVFNLPDGQVMFLEEFE